MQAISLIRERFGIAILLIEHDMSLVMNVCERIVVIEPPLWDMRHPQRDDLRRIGGKQVMPF